jgi:hypothetical protein
MEVDNKNEAKKIKKTDLLRFQKSLNAQFMEIFAQKMDASSEYVESDDTLGLSIFFRELNLFISLKDLQSIATKINYENSIRTKSWVLGFNQDHGRIYTIFNLNKVFSMLIDNQTDFEIPPLSMNSNILYLKNNLEEHFGMLLEDFKLEYTAEFSLIFDHKTDKDGFMSWEMASDVEFDTFIKKENMSEAEWQLISKINEISHNKEKNKYGIYPEHNVKDKYMLLALMVNKVYLDSFGKKPLFMLNMRNLTKFLMSVSPF